MIALVREPAPKAIGLQDRRKRAAHGGGSQIVVLFH
jgi:hypothetical protein